jgi:glycosyl hydrolase family 31
MISSSTAAFLLLVFISPSPPLFPEPKAQSPKPPELESFDLPPFHILLIREPPRLSFHFGGRLLVAQKPGRERGSMEFLLDSGWHAARALSGLRELPGAGDGKPGGARGLVADLELEGGLSATLRIERGDGEAGDLRLELSGPPGALAARDALLRDHDESLLGVEGVRWDDPRGPPGPEDDLIVSQEGPRFFLSSRGYGAVVDPPVSGKRSRIHACDPDTIRLEMRGGRLVYRLIPGREPLRILEARSRLAKQGGIIAPGAPLPEFAPPILYWLARPVPRDAEKELEVLSRLGVQPGAMLVRGEKGEMTPLLAERFPLSAGAAAAWSVAPGPGRVVDRELPATFDGLRRAVREALLLAVLGTPEVAFRFSSNRPPPPDFHSRCLEVTAFLPVQLIEAGRTVPGGAAEQALSRGVRLRREIVTPLLDRAREGGRPSIRPLFLAEPSDPAAWSAADEWLIGDTLLVAPVLDEGATRRSVRLPAGEWEDAWGDAGKALRIKGPVTLEVEAPPGDVPLFRKRGG